MSISRVSLKKGGKALLLGSVFPVRCQTTFFKYYDLTGLDRAWWFCHHVNSIYYIFLLDTVLAQALELSFVALGVDVNTKD